MMNFSSLTKLTFIRVSQHWSTTCKQKIWMLDTCFFNINLLDWTIYQPFTIHTKLQLYICDCLSSKVYSFSFISTCLLCTVFDSGLLDADCESGDPVSYLFSFVPFIAHVRSFMGVTFSWSASLVQQRRIRSATYSHAFMISQTIMRFLLPLANQ